MIRAVNNNKMRITIQDSVGFEPLKALELAKELIKNRPPKDGGLDYGLETHGLFGITLIDGAILNKPIQVYQTNKRKSEKAPISIIIEKHIPLI